MRVRQRAYLRLASDGLSPDEITALLGVAADDAKVRGSRSPGPPPVPRTHLWNLNSGVAEDGPVGDHLDALWPRLQQIAEGLRIFTGRSDSAAFLTLVRYFEEGKEGFDEAKWGLPPDSNLERVGGQHPFLGFALDVDRVRFLASVGLGLDVDEYG